MVVDKKPRAKKLFKGMSEKAAYFITADDEFIAANRAREIFEELSRDVTDDMSKEVIDAAANKTEDAVDACRRTREACATLSLFGGKKVVWMRGVNFINDSRQGASETVRTALDNLAEFLAKLDANSAAIVISASPVDRRKKFFKDAAKFAECEDFQEKDPTAACVALLSREAEKLKIRLDPDAAETLAAIVAGNPRMAVQELEKLAAYVNFERPVTAKDVTEMVPIFGEGDFFDISNAFYSGNLDSALGALRRYFFANKNASARPIITILQKQNSLLIQLRSLMDSGVLRASPAPQPRGAIESAASRFAEFFGDLSIKSNYNLFSQNAWYAGTKLAPIASKFTLRKLIDCQMHLAKAFEELIVRPNSDESIMRDLFVRAI